MRKLRKEISELRNMFTQSAYYNHYDPNYMTRADTDRVSVSSGVSRDLYEELGMDAQADNSLNNTANSEFTFNIETKLKEPAVPKTPEGLIKTLVDVQHFGKPTWSEVRYAETQKSYNHSPGFVDLEVNSEVKQYDSLIQLAKSDKAYAAITFGILKQKESLQNCIRSLLTWCKSESNLGNINSKIEELFLNGEFHKISSDLLQLVCGHRCEIIQLRRDAIIKQVKDPLVKGILNKIPPSTTHLFESDAFSAALEKVGGVRKAFWMTKSNSLQRSSTRKTSPPRGKLPVAPSYGAHDYTPGPSRPVYNTLAPSKGGYRYEGSQNYITSQKFRGSFPNRSSGLRGSKRGGRGRDSNAQRGNNKHLQQ